MTGCVLQTGGGAGMEMRGGDKAAISRTQVEKYSRQQRDVEERREEEEESVPNVAS